MAPLDWEQSRLSAQQEGFEAWFSRGALLLRNLRNLQFEIGDWLLEGDKFDVPAVLGSLSHVQGGPAWAAIGEVARRTGYDLDRLRNFKRVARAFPPETRRRVSYGHHEAVAAIEDEAERENLIDQAEVFKTSVADLRERVRKYNGGKPKPYYYKPREDPRVLKLAKEGERVGITEDDIVRGAIDEFFEGATAEIWLEQQRRGARRR